MEQVTLLTFVFSDLFVFLGPSGLVSDFTLLQLERLSFCGSFLFLLCFGPKKLVMFLCVVFVSHVISLESSPFHVSLYVSAVLQYQSCLLHVSKKTSTIRTM